MPPTVFDTLGRAVRSRPVTAALILAVLVVNLVAMNGVRLASAFILQSRFSRLYPWCLLTYVVVVPEWQLLYVPAYVLLMARWGEAAEAAVGSVEYAMRLLCTVLATAVCVVLLDAAVLYPIGTLTGGTAVRYDRFNDEAVWSPSMSGWNQHYMYWGIWPVAQAIVMVLCRERGLTSQIGPAVGGRRLTLQRLPLALICLAVASDVWVWLTSHGNVDLGDKAVSRASGFNSILGVVALLVAWRYDRHVDAAVPPFYAFFYPAKVQAVVRRAGELTWAALRPSRLAFLLPPREAGGAAAAAAAMPLPVFANAANAAVPSSTTPEGTTLLPGTTAEEAERYRLIAREALARRLQEQREQHRPEIVNGAAAAADSVAVETPGDDKTA